MWLWLIWALAASLVAVVVTAAVVIVVMIPVYFAKYVRDMWRGKL